MQAGWLAAEAGCPGAVPDAYFGPLRPGFGRGEAGRLFPNVRVMNDFDHVAVIARPH